MPKAPYRVVVDDMTERIADGRLKEGDRLPSSTQLAAEHGVSRSTADSAYQILDDRWLIEGRSGAGRHVARGAGRLARERLRREFERGDRPDPRA